MSTHYTLTIRPATGGQRKFAVTTEEAACESDYQSGEIQCQSDQTYEAKVWERIADRGYVCRIVASGQWANRGNHGVYLGTGATAEAALRAAWSDCGDDVSDEQDIPLSLLAPIRDYDAEVRPVEIE